MRISGWHINGFGMFADYREDDLPAGLTVLYGPNEAGKSTLVSYILDILFGFSDGRSKGPHYEPFMGGNQGGKLFLRDDAGQYVIERTKAGKVPTVRYPDNEAGGQDAIKDLLGGADRTLFQNVFAFGLKELEDLKALEGDSVRERIFATPTFGGGPTAREIIKKLESREKDLLKPRSASTITDLRLKLEGTHGELLALQREAKAYEQAMRDLDEAGEVVDRISGELGEKRQEATRQRTLIEVWPQWSDRLSAQQEAESIKIPDGVEPASEARLREAEQTISELEAVVGERRKEVERQQSRLNKVVVDDLLPPVEQQVKKLHAEVQRYDADRSRLGTLDTRIETLETDVSRALADLGTEWDTERVEVFDTSIPIKGKLVEWRDRLSGTDRTVEEAAKHVADLEGRLEEASTERSGHEQKLERYAETPPSEEIEESEVKTRRLRVLSEEVGKLRERVRAAEERSAAVAAALAGAGRRSGAGVPPASLFAVPAVLGVAGVAMGIAGEALSAILFIVLAVASGVGIVLWRRSTGTGSEGNARRPDTEPSAAVDETRRVLEAAEAGARDLAAELGFSEIPNPVQLEERLGAIARHRADREAADVVAGLLGGALEKERKLRESIDATHEELETRRSTRTQLEDEWTGWRTEHGIAESMKPEVVMDLVSAIAKTRDSIRQGSEARTEASQVRQRIENFEQSASEVLTAAERDADVVDSGLMAAVETLYQDVLADESERRSIAGLAKGIAGAQRGSSEAEVNLEQARAVRDGVLAEAGVADGAALGDALARLKRRTELEQETVRLSRFIESKVGGGESGALMREELATGDLPRWQAELEGVTTLTEQLEKGHEEAVRNHQDLRTSADRVANSSDVAEKALAVEAYRVELAEAAAEWARLAIARALIDATLTRFERKHQPKVVGRAAELFDQITAGRYPALMSTEGSLKVLSRTEDVIDVVDLSTGTVQQLYLSLRFALAEEFAQRGTKLPLVMDDVLVNFDQERAAQMADVISGIASTNQVLLLTCHSATVGLMTQSSPDARIIELSQFNR